MVNIVDPHSHEIWDAALIDETAERYPKLDLNPWRSAIGLDAVRLEAEA